MWRGGIISAYSATKHSGGHEHRNSRQERKWKQKQRPWRTPPSTPTADRPASSSWLSYFPNTAQDHLPRDGISSSDLGLPASILSQENVPQTHRLVSRQSDRGTFSVDDSTLCQVDEKLSKTIYFWSRDTAE